MKKHGNTIFFIAILVIAVVGAIFIYKYFDKNGDKKIKKNINTEYTLVSESNVYEYSDYNTILNVLDKGTGIIFFGFPECPWCQYYAKYVNEAAQDNKIDKIYYYNIKEDRSNNSQNYKTIVSYIEDNLLTDDSNNKRIYVPDVTIVKNGKVIAHDNETSVINDGTNPEEYWTTENIQKFKEKFNKYFSDYKASCTTCN